MTYIHLYINEIKTFKYIPYAYQATWWFQPYNTLPCIINSNMRSIFDQINVVIIILVIPKPRERITFPNLFIFLFCFHIQIQEYQSPWGPCGFWMATCMFLTNLSGFFPDPLWIIAVYGQLEWAEQGRTLQEIVIKNHWTLMKTFSTNTILIKSIFLSICLFIV